MNPKLNPSQIAKRKKAARIVRNALKKGTLVKPHKCQACDAPALLVAHHANYNRPLKVLWLCQKCHYAIHGLKRPPKNLFEATHLYALLPPL